MEELKTTMNLRLDNEVSALNEQYNRLHEQQLLKLRKLKKELKALKH